MKEYIISSDDVKAIEEEFNIIISFDKDDELIRCKDCKFSSPNGVYGCTVYHFRKYETHEMKPDDFCSRAEPKETNK